MFCPHCGATVSERARFCGSCGKTIAVAEVPPAGGVGGNPPPAPSDPFGPPSGYTPPAGGYVPPGFPQPAGSGFSAPPPFVPPATVDVKTGAWISEGWEIVKADLGGMALLTLVFMLVNGVIPIVLTGPTMIGFYIYISKRLMGRPAELGDLFKGFNWFVPSLVASILIALFVNIGMILCIIPGFVVMAMYGFTYHFIFDRNMDFWPAMQASHEVVKKNYFGFTMFLLALGVVNLCGLLLCVVGLFITVPITYAAITVAYRDLVGFDPATPWANR